MSVNGFTGEDLARLAHGAGLVEPAIVVRGTRAGDEAVELEPRRVLASASMIKVPIAFALEAARARGDLALRDTVRVGAENMTLNDAPSPFVEGAIGQLGELGRAMLAKSDNVATNVLIDVLGRDQIDRVSASLGLEGTHVRRKLSGALPLIADPVATGRNAHPASDAARLFALLADPQTRPPWIWDALLAQIWNDKLPRGWERGDVFAHKTGDTDEVSHDGGVLALPNGRSFIVVVYTALASGPHADACLTAFARGLRPYLM